MNDHEMTPALSEAITTLAAEVLDVAREAGKNTPELNWLHAVGALAVACRGLAAQAMADDPRLDLDKARQMMTLQFINVMSLPAELVRVMKAEEGESPRTIVIPVKKH
jgi:hypothetical protein